MPQDHQSPKLNGLVVTYILFALVCVIIDYFKLVEYYIVRENNVFHLKINVASQIYTALTVFILLVLLVTLVSLVLKKYKELLAFIYFPKIGAIDWPIIIFFILITFLRLPIPDGSFDVVNYHLFLQGFGFENNLNYNFFPGNIQTFIFPLGDRLFYVFRMLLGYRGGTLLSTLILILLFFQTKDLMQHNENTRIAFRNKNFMFSLSALFAVSTEYILATLGIYMIDSLMLPFLLELLKVTIVRKTSSHFALLYSGLLVGLSISIKLTSAVFCMLLFVVIFFRYYRGISIRTIYTSLLILLFPLVPYVVYNFTQTHNPVFPFYNNYFGSPFTAPVRFSEPAFGPKTWFEILSWPIYILFSPIRTNQIPYYSGRLGIGLLAAIICTGMVIKKKTDQFLFCLLGVGLLYLWSVTTGVIRYGLFLEIFLGMLIVDFVCGLYNLDLNIMCSRLKAIQILNARYSHNRHFIHPKLVAFIHRLDFKLFLIRSLAIFMIIISLAQCTYTYYLSTVTNIADWSQRPSAPSNWLTYTHNIKLIGKDYLPLQYKNPDNLESVIREIDVWIVLPPDNFSGYEKLLKDNIPILNLQMSRSTQETLDIFLSLQKNLNLRSKNIYMIGIRPLDVITKELDQYGFQMITFYEIQPTFTYFPLKLIEVALK